jgi:hypothetical protein
MLVELAACNAAFAVIKETVQNGGDIMAAGQKLFDFFDNKNAIQKKANNNNDMEAFAALEQIKNNEAELKRMMVYHGRAGLWGDWLKFQKEAKQRREAEEKAEFRKKAARKENFLLSAARQQHQSTGSVEFLINNSINHRRLTNDNSI